MFKLSDNHPDAIKMKNNELQSIKIEDNTFKDIKEGKLKDIGTIHFSTYDEIYKLLSFCDIKYINQHSTQIIYDTVNSQYYYDEYIAVGIKK